MNAENSGKAARAKRESPVLAGVWGVWTSIFERGAPGRESAPSPASRVLRLGRQVAATFTLAIASAGAICASATGSKPGHRHILGRASESPLPDPPSREVVVRSRLHIAGGRSEVQAVPPVPNRGCCGSGWADSDGAIFARAGCWPALLTRTVERRASVGPAVRELLTIASERLLVVNQRDRKHGMRCSDDTRGIRWVGSPPPLSVPCHGARILAFDLQARSAHHKCSAARVFRTAQREALH